MGFPFALGFVAGSGFQFAFAHAVGGTFNDGDVGVMGDPRKLIALTTAAVAQGKSEAFFRIPPEFHDRAAWDSRDPNEAVEIAVSTLRAYSPTLVVPLLPRAISYETLRSFMNSPAIAGHPCLRTRRVYADFETSKHDKRYWHDERAKAVWPVYAGESFDIWRPDTGAYYAFTQGTQIAEAAHIKWNRAPSGSPYAELPTVWRRDPENHPIHFPRIAFRDVTNRTNTRTLVVALIPPHVVTVQTAPWVLWLNPEHAKSQEAYLLGIMSSIPCDWWCRRFIEGHADQEAFSCLRIPDPSRQSKLSQRVVALAGRLASPDHRFSQWVRAVGVECGRLEDDEKEDVIHELDAVVAHLYGLNESQLRHIFETFHEGWDYARRLDETLRHYHSWATRR
ncbi:MAG: hypothetical protein ABSH52_10795 [Terriglobia bacterium]|jgi:hypothetical protein